MAITYGTKRKQHHIVLHTVITAFLLIAVFLSMVVSFYDDAITEAHETLHLQTKQIKDDITLQLLSDRENLATMASFAAKLYSDGEGYDLLFSSFKPIGLIENIGILTPDNRFHTKAGVLDLTGKISFSEEAKRGTYISGRVKDLTRENADIIRSAVPVRVDGHVVGVLYGVIKPEVICARYDRMAKELDAQLFVFDREHGELVIDTVHETLGNISFLKDREYKDGYSYEEIAETEKGFSSFRSAYREETVHLHYSTIEELDWKIALVRYDSQVYATTNVLLNKLLIAFFLMLLIIFGYIMVLMVSERSRNAVVNSASELRKTLLEAGEHENHIAEALAQIVAFSDARSAIFFDTNDQDYSHIADEFKDSMLAFADRNFLRSELFRYAMEFHKNRGSALNILCIKPNAHLLETNPTFHRFLSENGISEVSFSATVSSTNHITILAVINPRHAKSARALIERVAACFAMALTNMTRLNETELAATTDALTGVLNRVSYTKDAERFDREKPGSFSCVFVDVNELHLCNNKYGHAAGDKMLCYIADTLRELFLGQSVYRIGGDEFLVFCKDLAHDEVLRTVELVKDKISQHNYHAAIGVSFREVLDDIDELVREAETRMYEAKAAYYQEKEQNSSDADSEQGYTLMQTGISEIDTILSLLKENYLGICRVSLDTDAVRIIMLPSDLDPHDADAHFSPLFSKYVSNAIHSDYHRSVSSFLNYEVLKVQLANGEIPTTSFRKLNGDTAILRVYPLSGEDAGDDTLWVFAKRDIS